MSNRALDANVLEDIQNTLVRPCFFFEVELPSGTWRGWTSYRAITYMGETWDPVPGLIKVDGYSESIDTAAKGVSMSFVVMDATKMADVYSGSYWGSSAKVYLATLDEKGNPRGFYLWFSGVLDTDQVDRSAGAMLTVTFKLEHRLSDLLRKRVLRYTPEDQKLLHPTITDKGFDFAVFMKDLDLPWGE